MTDKRLLIIRSSSRIRGFRKQHNIDNVDIFVNFVFQFRRDYQLCIGSFGFLMCNYQSVYLGVSFSNILEKLYLKISQISVDRYVIFVLLLIYEKLDCLKVITGRNEVGPR